MRTATWAPAEGDHDRTACQLLCLHGCGRSLLCYAPSACQSWHGRFFGHPFEMTFPCGADCLVGDVWCTGWAQPACDLCVVCPWRTTRVFGWATSVQWLLLTSEPLNHLQIKWWRQTRAGPASWDWIVDTPKRTGRQHSSQQTTRCTIALVLHYLSPVASKFRSPSVARRPFVQP